MLWGAANPDHARNAEQGYHLPGRISAADAEQGEADDDPCDTGIMTWGP